MRSDIPRELEAAVESILFASGEPVHIDRFCVALSLERAEVEEILCRLRDYYAFERRGIRLLQLEDSWQLCSSPDHGEVVRKAFEIRKPAKLSQPALEALTIVAYYQPTTRAYVDKLRGVDSSYTMNLLAERGLIETCGRLQVPGRPLLYRTTEQFLRAFHLTSLEELPPLPDGEALPDGETPPGGETLSSDTNKEQTGRREIGRGQQADKRQIDKGEADKGQIDKVGPPSPSQERGTGGEVPDGEAQWEDVDAPPVWKRRGKPRRVRRAERKRQAKQRSKRRTGHARGRGHGRRGGRRSQNGTAEKDSSPSPDTERGRGRAIPHKHRKVWRWMRCLFFGCWVSWPWWQCFC